MHKVTPKVVVSSLSSGEMPCIITRKKKSKNINFKAEQSPSFALSIK